MIYAVGRGGGGQKCGKCGKFVVWRFPTQSRMPPLHAANLQNKLLQVFRCKWGRAALHAARHEAGVAPPSAPTLDSKLPPLGVFLAPKKSAQKKPLTVQAPGCFFSCACLVVPQAKAAVARGRKRRAPQDSDRCQHQASCLGREQCE